MLKNTCSYKGPGFDSQHPHASSKRRKGVQENSNILSMGHGAERKMSLRVCGSSLSYPLASSPLSTQDSGDLGICT